MRLTTEHTATGQHRRFVLTIEDAEYISAEFMPWDLALFTDIEEGARSECPVADSLLGVELIARRIEEAAARKRQVTAALSASLSPEGGRPDRERANERKEITVTTFDDAIAQAVAEYRLSETYLAAARAANGVLSLDLVARTAERDMAEDRALDLQAELTECRNPTPPPPPVVRVPLGLYSGTLQELQARETLLGKTNIPSWLFLSMGQTVPAGWNTPRTIIVNVHARVGGTHIKWKDVNSGAYDSQLIATLKSIGTLTQATVYLSVQEEQDGVEGGTHGSPSDYRTFFNHVSGLASLHCPNAKVGQVLANADRLSAWIAPGVEWFGFDPHFYGWPALSFAQRLDNIIINLKANFALNVPYSVHTGGVENPNDPNAKAGQVRGMGAVLLNPPTPRPFLVTYWDRSGVVNGQNADERVDSSPASLAAFREVFA